METKKQEVTSAANVSQETIRQSAFSTAVAFMALDPKRINGSPGTFTLKEMGNGSFKQVNNFLNEKDKQSFDLAIKELVKADKLDVLIKGNLERHNFYDNGLNAGPIFWDLPINEKWLRRVTFNPIPDYQNIVDKTANSEDPKVQASVVNSITTQMLDANRLPSEVWVDRESLKTVGQDKGLQTILNSTSFKGKANEVFANMNQTQVRDLVKLTAGSDLVFSTDKAKENWFKEVAQKLDDKQRASVFEAASSLSADIRSGDAKRFMPALFSSQENVTETLKMLGNAQERLLNEKPLNSENQGAVGVVSELKKLQGTQNQTIGASLAAHAIQQFALNRLDVLPKEKDPTQLANHLKQDFNKLFTDQNKKHEDLVQAQMKLTPQNDGDDKVKFNTFDKAKDTLKSEQKDVIGGAVAAVYKHQMRETEELQETLKQTASGANAVSTITSPFASKVLQGISIGAGFIGFSVDQMKKFDQDVGSSQNKAASVGKELATSELISESLSVASAVTNRDTPYSLIQVTKQIPDVSKASMQSQQNQSTQENPNKKRSLTFDPTSNQGVQPITNTTEPLFNPKGTRGFNVLNLSPHESPKMPNAVNPNAVNPNAVNPNAVNPNAANPSAANPSAANPSAVNPDVGTQESLKPMSTTPEPKQSAPVDHATLWADSIKVGQASQSATQNRSA